MNATARTTQLLAIDTLLTDEEIAYRDNVRTFVTRQIRPNIARWFEEAHFPAQLAPELGSLGMLGAQLQGYGCPGRSAVEYGLGAMELEAGDSGIRTFVSVQGSLAMTAIHRWGSEEQKEYYLPGMARGEVIGCFALTEPTAGSDPASMLATATPTADGWILRGAKRWIGMASIAQIAIVWARTPDGIRGFIVPTDTPGFRAIPIAHKLSMRASLQCDILLDDVHLPPKAILAASSGLGSALACLNEARYGIIWGVMGAARDSIEAALAYVGQREQFGSAIAARQLVQQKLVDMVVEQQKGALLALHLGRLKDSDRLTPDQISFGKLSNTREAIEICRSARALLGGNGVTLDYSPLRHANNLESVRTYEGTDEMHTLILGQVLTGIAAFR